MSTIYLKLDISHEISTAPPADSGSLNKQVYLGQEWDTSFPTYTAWTEWSGWNWGNWSNPVSWLFIQYAPNELTFYTLSATITDHAFDAEQFGDFSGPTVNFSELDINGSVRNFAYLDYVWQAFEYNEPAAGFRVSDATITEGEGSTGAIFTISLSNPVPFATSVSFVTEDGSALAASDYSPVAGSLAFGPNTTSGQLRVPVVDDAQPEQVEAFQVRLSGASASGGAIPTIEDAVGVGTIQDDDTVSVSALGGDTASESGGASKFTLELSGPAAAPVTVTYSTVDGTAAGGTDFEAAVGQTVVIPEGDASADVYIPLIRDSTVEPEEFFSLRIDAVAAGSGAAPRVQSGFEQASADITDDDTATLSVSSKTASVTEGRDAPYFVFALSNPVATPVTVAYSVLDGSAKSGADFKPGSSLSVVIGPGETSAEAVVLLTDDEQAEDPEFFSLQVESVSGAGISPGLLPVGTRTASVSIYDDDTFLPDWIEQAINWIYDPLRPRREEILNAILDAIQASPDDPPTAFWQFVDEQLERWVLGDEVYERIFVPPPSPTPPPAGEPATRGPSYLDRFLDEAVRGASGGPLPPGEQSTDWGSLGGAFLI